MKAGEGRVFQRGSIWWIAYCAPVEGRSKEIRESAGKGASREDAEALKTRRLREVANARDGIRRFVGPRAERVTVKELLQKALARMEAAGRKSVDSSRSHANTVMERIGNHRAASVTSDVINRYIRGRQADGVKPSTIDHDLEILKRAFRLGVENHEVSFVPSFPKMLKPHENARQGFVSPEQFAALFENIDDADLRDFILWFWYTGMRPSEIGSLSWAGYDKAKGELRLQARHAKIGRGRVVPVVGPLKPIINRRLAARRDDSPLIFQQDGKPLTSPSGGLRKRFRNRWWKAVEAAGLPTTGEERVIPYDLRRAAVRNLREIGVPEKVAMQISGHTTRAMFDRYTIVETSDVADAFRALPPEPKRKAPKPSGKRPIRTKPRTRRKVR